FAWGHSSVSDAVSFGHRVGAARMLLFHHDPLHSDDFLDALAGEAALRWQELGGDPAQIELATERREIELDNTRPGRPGICAAVDALTDEPAGRPDDGQRVLAALRASRSATS